MAISFPLSPPTTPAYRSCTFRMVSKTIANTSPFTGHQQITAFPGQYWEADLELPLMNRTQAAAWQAWLAALNGSEGFFPLGDPDAKSPRGSGLGTPLVNGAGQTGQDLITDGWNASQTGVLLAGDYIQIDNNLYMVLSDVNSDGAGNATLSLFPKIRVAHSDNAPITANNTTGHFRLTDQVRSWQADENGHYAITFTCREKL